MSHEIYESDKQEGTSMAWHNKTDVKAVIILKECFLAMWDVVKRPLKREYVGKDGATVSEITDTCEIACTDDPSIVIGKTVDIKSYSLLTNAGFLEIVSNAIAQIAGAIVESVGSVCNRGRIFVSVSIPEFYTTAGKTVNGVLPSVQSTFTAAGRTFKTYLNFLSSHDKSCAFVVNMGSICTVCNNTFNMNLTDGTSKLRINIKHTSGMQAMLADVPAIISAFFVTVERFRAVIESLALIPISQADAKAFFVGFLFSKEQTEDTATETDKLEMSSRRSNQVDRLVELFNTGKGNAGLNLADLFSAFTDYYSHESSSGDDKFRQLASSEFGHGQTMKAAAFAIMQDDKKIATTIALGVKVLAAQKAD